MAEAWHLDRDDKRPSVVSIRQDGCDDLQSSTEVVYLHDAQALPTDSETSHDRGLSSISHASNLYEAISPLPEKNVDQLTFWADQVEEVQRELLSWSIHPSQVQETLFPLPGEPIVPVLNNHDFDLSIYQPVPTVGNVPRLICFGQAYGEVGSLRNPQFYDSMLDFLYELKAPGVEDLGTNWPYANSKRNPVHDAEFNANSDAL